MTRNTQLMAAVAVAMLLAGALALVTGFGLQGPSVAQAQEEPPSETFAQGAPFTLTGAEARGVEMVPGETEARRASQAVQPPPLILSEEAEAAKERAERGEAPPTGKRIVQAPEAEAAGDSLAPTLGKTFRAISGDSTGPFPPDHQIAAGPNNVLVATNAGYRIFDKDGRQRDSGTLVDFFSPLGTEHDDVFDPWLVYDPYIQKFWFLAASGRTTAHSDMVIGVSRTSDATLGWRLWEIDATLNGGTDTQNWCDYPKIGFDRVAIYVTCNMFQLNTDVTPNRNEFQYAKIRVITKGQFLADSNPGFVGWDFWDLDEGNNGEGPRAFTIQPAQMFGASTADGEFLVDSQGGNTTGGSDFDVWHITNAAECCDNDAVAPTLAHRTQTVGGYSPPPNAEQSGSATQIHTGDARLLYAFWQGGRLSTGQTIACGDVDACAAFTELNVSGFPTISTLNDFAYARAGVDLYYPAVAANAFGRKTMVFSRSSPSEFASARYIGIPPSSVCTDCLDGPERVLRSGSTTYDLQDSRNRNRWGDYSGSSPDPNGQGVWVAGEAAASPANTWVVQVGLTHQGAPPASNDNFWRSRVLSGPRASVAGQNVFATREPFEPDHLPGNASLGEHSVWYSWTAPHSGTFTMNTCSSNFNTVLSVYRGNSLKLLSLGRIRSDNDSCTLPFNSLGSRLSFNAVEGRTYRIAVSSLRKTGFIGKRTTGSFTLSVTDTQPPRVVDANPNATGIPRETNVNAFFSEPMREDSVTASFKLFREGSNDALNARVTYDARKQKATLDPNADLRPGTRYRAVVTTGARDTAGNQLDQNTNTAGNQEKAWFFTTRR